MIPSVDLQKQLTEKESEVRDLSEKVKHTKSLEKELEDLKLNNPPQVEPNVYVISLQKKIEKSDKLINENNQVQAQMKRNNELSLNKLCIARVALDNFLSDNISDPEFNEFHPSFKFIVAQYSSLLSSPDHYTVNSENNAVTIHTELFENIDGSDPVVSKNLEHFQDQLKLKLELDCAKRVERRNSVGRGRNSSISSKSKKRQLDILTSDTTAKRSPSTHDHV